MMIVVTMMIVIVVIVINAVCKQAEETARDATRVADGNTSSSNFSVF